MRTSTIKSLAAITLTGLGSALVLGFRTQDAPILASSRTAMTNSTTATGTAGTRSTRASPSTTASGSTGAASTPAAPAGPSAPVAAAAYADGSWTGKAVEEPWGTFQVKAVVSGGQITDVILVAAPPDGNSNRINSRAVPALTQAAVAAQSARIDMVSGATWTSDSYVTSLQAALDKARAAAQTAP